MKVALVSLRAVDPCFPISLLSLHSYLKAHGVEADILDAAYDNVWERLKNGYDLVGISAMSADYESATKLAIKIRGELGVPVVIGGVHISKLPESFRDVFNVAVIGEGEKPLLELVRLYERTKHPTRQDLSAINGLLYRDGLELKQTPVEPLDLSNLPHFDYDAISPQYFKRAASATFGRFGVEAMIISSRGCPFHCVFCASSHFWHNVRYYPVPWVIEEMRSLIARGVELIDMADDLFACNKNRLRQIGKAMEGLNVTLSCSGNASIFDVETCRLLKKMNVVPIFFGFESGDDQTLKYLKCGKNSVEDNRRAVMLCRKWGFYAWGGLIIGSPGETSESIENTISFAKWARSMGATRICISILHPFPGTPIWDQAMKGGKVSIDMDFDKLKLDSKESTEGFFVSDEFRPQFIALRDKAFRSIHPFKWKKVSMLLKDNPLDTIRFAMSAPLPILKRLFSSITP